MGGGALSRWFILRVAGTGRVREGSESGFGEGWRKHPLLGDTDKNMDASCDDVFASLLDELKTKAGDVATRMEKSASAMYDDEVE